MRSTKLGKTSKFQKGGEFMNNIRNTQSNSAPSDKSMLIAKIIIGLIFGLLIGFVVYIVVKNNQNKKKHEHSHGAFHMHNPFKNADKWDWNPFDGIDKQEEEDKEEKDEVKKEEKKPKEEEMVNETGVYHIADNDYTYNEAKCKCSAYDGQLATESQMIEAFNKGANWCSYGWTQGQKAMYPVQQNFWDELQLDPSKKDNCGNVGLNGGYFNDPELKFGVNCYGVRPKPTANLNIDKCSTKKLKKNVNDTIYPFK